MAKKKAPPVNSGTCTYRNDEWGIPIPDYLDEAWAMEDYRKGPELGGVEAPMLPGPGSNEMNILAEPGPEQDYRK